VEEPLVPDATLFILATGTRCNERFLHFGRNDENPSFRPEPAGGVEEPLVLYATLFTLATGMRRNERVLRFGRNDGEVVL